MKRVGKPWFFVIVLLIIALTYTAFFGVYGQNGDVQATYIRGAKDIRWGTDIQGGVEATFGPDGEYNATDDQMENVKNILEQRLVLNGVTDYEVYVDTGNDRVIMSFPWKDGQDQNAEATIAELSASAEVLFIDGDHTSITVSYDENGNETIVNQDGEAVTVSVRGDHVATASYELYEGQWQVVLDLTSEGSEIFSAATSRMYGDIISIWMNYGTTCVKISAPQVSAVITDGQATISGGFTAETAKELADSINDGALPFMLKVVDYDVIDATLGKESLNTMLIAGIIAFILVAVFMIAVYRLPGAVACISLIGQVAATIAIVSGYFPFINSSTLTLPGIAGIILSVGMQIDANVITSERIKEELARGKTLDGAIDAANTNSISAIIDGNMANIIVSIILMGVFGPTSTLWSKILTPFLFMFGPATTGAIYSFGFTMFVGAILNFVFGVFCSRIMLKSISGFKLMRNKKLYGGEEA